MITQAQDAELLSLVAPALVGSPFERPASWGNAVVVLRPEGRRVTSRGCFAHELMSNDLLSAANECIARRVPRGHVLVWLEVDVVHVADARFVVFDLARAVRKARAC